MRLPLIGMLSGDRYRARVLRGGAMTFLGIGGHNILRLASNLILTRLLFPEAFGLMTLVQVVLGGAAMFSDFGLRGSVIQDERSNEPSFLGTIYSFQIGRGFLLMLIVMALAAPMAAFYEAPQLRDLLVVSALVPAITGLQSVNVLTTNRDIRLGRMTLVMLTTQAAGIVAMILLAWWFQSVWALVIGNLLTALMQVVLTHMVLPGRFHRPGFDRDAARRIMGFGRFVFFATVATFFTRQGDKAVLGLYISLEALAIYNIGFFLASVPFKLAAALNDRVVYPLYARVPPWSSATNRRKINTTRRGMTAVLIAATLALALAGDWLVRLLYDPRYHDAGPILVMIGLATLLPIVVQSYERLPLAAGDSGRFALYTVTKASVQMAFLVLGTRLFGLSGAILAPACATIVMYPLMVRIMRSYRAWDPLHDALYATLSLLLAAGVAWFHAERLEPLIAPIRAII